MKLRKYLYSFNILIILFIVSTLSLAKFSLPRINDKPTPMENDWRIALLQAARIPFDKGILVAGEQLERYQLNLKTGVSQSIDNAFSPFNWSKTMLNMDINEQSNLLPNPQKLPENLPYWKVKDRPIIIIPILSSGKYNLSAGFMSIQENNKHIINIRYFYSPDTPGLGQEVLNEDFGKRFVNLPILNQSNNFAIALKTKDAPENTNITQIDGISGATITSTGVIDAIHYWYKIYSILLNKI